MAARTVTVTNMLGVRERIKCYELNGRRVREYPDGSILYEVRPAHFRPFPATHNVTRAIKSGQQVSALRETSRRKPGTHEPVTYHVDTEGKIGVPTDPSLPPPDNVTVHVADTLTDIDRITRLMESQQYAEFQDDGVATAAFDDVLGFDRDALRQAASTGRGRKEREVARLMLADLDREAAARQQISVRMGFRFRDFDGGSS